jgi:hypothetical protein
MEHVYNFEKLEFFNRPNDYFHAIIGFAEGMLAV